MTLNREEFGFARTVCDCAECTINCHYLPGYLIPADLARMTAYAKHTDLIAFALAFLLASPGATVLERGQLRQIPTLVPTRRADGACIFLDEKNHCRLHTVSPFGCAFFDQHQRREESDERSYRGLQQIAAAWAMDHPYAQLWRLLRDCGRIAPAPIVARRQMQAALTAIREADAGAESREDYE